ncbi:VOC family protein [Quadrisphaera setariae]|uniref:VOC family protein n=1 Tax=Quadrisphaera setariae TaxID=2593304 RepID=A0A5C8ZIM4_9ACTN|nr:VOC family protein [Quadrisphaera setariae]TXR56961.1 VOC family protein [Quadrisphaera setariae]
MTTPSSTSELLLPGATTMDAVTLHVADLPGTTAYYRDALGLVELDGAVARTAVDLATPGAAGAQHAVLGRGGTPLVVLVHTPGLPAPKRGEAGLFHTALLFPDRAGLADAVARAAQHPRSRYVGSADHLVSNAFYFTDPEDNGIELYWDRPREQWDWKAGQVVMDNAPLDPDAFLREHVSAPLDQPARSDAEVGHVHLKVGDVEVARAFYVDTLGFEVTAEWHGALFVAAGGYHHHMAMNTWSSRGAGARAATLGLGQVSLVLPARSDLDALADRLRAARVDVRDDGRTLRFEDPWKSLLEVSAAA